MAPFNAEAGGKTVTTRLGRPPHLSEEEVNLEFLYNTRPMWPPQVDLPTWASVNSHF